MLLAVYIFDVNCVLRVVCDVLLVMLLVSGILSDTYVLGISLVNWDSELGAAWPCTRSAG